VAQVQAVISNVPQNPGSAYTVSGNTVTFTSAPPSGTNNIYVYYTSPITQVIQPCQGTVQPTSLSQGGPSWDTSGNLNSVVNLTTTGNTILGDASTDTLNVGNGGLIKDASGNVGVGVTPSGSASSSMFFKNNFDFYVKDSGGTFRRFMEYDNSNNLYFGMVDGPVSGGGLYFRSGTGTTTNMLLDSSGNLLVGATSGYGEKFNVTGSVAGYLIRSYNSNANPYGCYYGYTAAAPNNTSNDFIRFDDNAAMRATIRSNGGLANYSANNVNLASDLRLKHDIEPVKSYWNVFKSIEWKTWVYNDQTDEVKNIGVIAQELQALAPEFVCESNALPTPEGESPYLGLWENDFKMAAMSVITELVKKSEEQQALITNLTERLVALEGK
jgi:hypothetical protein